uniref:Uncharacterized protein n=1 Tax=Opuntia streptacantha TaxID=393608 RepID=A0A7C9AY46_OPUST
MASLVTPTNRTPSPFSFNSFIHSYSASKCPPHLHSPSLPCPTSEQCSSESNPDSSSLFSLSSHSYHLQPHSSYPLTQKLCYSLNKRPTYTTTSPSTLLSPTANGQAYNALPPKLFVSSLNPTTSPAFSHPIR